MNRRHLPIMAAVLATAVAAHAFRAEATTCADESGAAGLTDVFAGHVEGIAGADYQRALLLPDGRTLWVFQDAFLQRRTGPDRLVHNVGLIQAGSCFQLLRGGTADEPEAWLGADLTEPHERWFWPLGATIAGDGSIALFVAEMREHGPTYLSRTEPAATWLVTIDPAAMTPIEFRPAPDPGPALYGWSVASDDQHTYLYGHCYRQFGFGFLGHDECAANVTVARTPRGELDGPLRYWDGSHWVSDPSAAVNIAPQTTPSGVRRGVNPMQVAHVDGRWIAVTKDADWWGDKIYLDRAPSPSGPWTTGAVLDAAPFGPDHNTYFASLIPGTAGEVIIGLSNNRWDGQRTDSYRPTFTSMPLSRWSHPDSAPERPATCEPSTR